MTKNARKAPQHDAHVKLFLKQPTLTLEKPELEAWTPSPEESQDAQAAIEAALGTTLTELSGEAKADRPAPKLPVIREIVLKDAWLSKGYAYTPTVEGKTRWFDLRMLKKAEAVEGGVKLHIDEKMLKKRGIPFKELPEVPYSEAEIEAATPKPQPSHEMQKLEQHLEEVAQQ